MKLARLLVARTGLAALTLLLVSILVFAAIEIIPGDAATRYLGRDATPEAMAAVRARMHLDDPAHVRYLRWISGAVTGDLGTSLVSDRPVTQVLAAKIRNTAILAVVAFLVYLPLAVVPAAIAALNRDRFSDHVITSVNLLAVSIPPFLLATFLLVLFVLVLPWLPAISAVTSESTVGEYARALCLPALTLAISMAAYTVRMLRDNLIEVLESDYVRMAELKGMSRRRVLLRHALPNALGPSLNITALNIAFLVSGVVVVEKVFAFPGFGRELVDSLLVEDQPVVQATVLLASAVYIVANLAADLGTLLLNPRLRED